MALKQRKKFFGLIVGGIFLFMICIAITFTWYKIFQHDKVAVTNLTIALKDTGKGINIDSMVPMSDAESKSVPVSNFEITNNTDSVGRYEVLLVDDLKMNSDETKEFLTRDQLKYELKLNGKVIAKDSLSNIKKNQLDSRLIDGNKMNVYELRIWVPLETKNWENKIYHYKVVVNPINIEEE